jgi:uncharacterized protein (DUF2147 family)
MSKDQRRDRDPGKSKGQLVRQRMYIHMLVMVLVLAVFAAGTFFLLHGRTKAGTGTKAAFNSLKGRWQRPDGGYVIEIKEIDASGKMVAAYFNPRPINVSRAEASREGDATKIFIELRDVNYPGATYNLTYDPAIDQLRGVYYQPLLQQSFEVVFVRMK